MDHFKIVSTMLPINAEIDVPCSSDDYSVSEILESASRLMERRIADHGPGGEWRIDTDSVSEDPAFLALARQLNNVVNDDRFVQYVAGFAAAINYDISQTEAPVAYHLIVDCDNDADDVYRILNDGEYTQVFNDDLDEAYCEAGHEEAADHIGECYSEYVNWEQIGRDADYVLVEWEDTFHLIRIHD
jgi:hypothetical protein